jgi:predicted nuclease with TOPRIM domain
MNDPATKADLKALEDKTEARFDEIMAVMSEFANDTQTKFGSISEQFAQVDTRFAQVDARFDEIEKKFTQVDARFDHIDEKLDRIVGMIDHFVGEASNVEVESLTRDRIVDRHERWIHELADHQGIKLAHDAA